MTVSGLKQTIANLEKLGAEMVPAATAALQQGAAILADDIRRRLEGNLIGSKYSTGDLLESFGITPVRINRSGKIDVKVGFHGYDRNGVPNQLKARAMESGTSRGQKKKPFVRPAVRYNRKRIQELMDRIIHVRLERITKGGK